MSDLAEAIHIIRAFLKNPAAQPDESTRLAAETYRSRLTDASLRMRQCIFYLERDRISEAVHLASQEPSLLQSCADIMFPEASAWAAQATINGLPAPTGDISATDIERLNQAFLREENVADLLRLHRRWALVRAPLSRRIEVLRRLADADPLVPGWRDDQRQLEELRLKEIHEALPGLLERRDPAALDSYEKELDSGSWLTKPPPNWLAALRKTREDIHAEQVQAEFLRLSAALDAAFSAQDQADGFALQREWKKLLATGIPAPQALSRAQPALTWLERETIRQERIVDFERSLEALNLAIGRGQSEKAILHRLREAKALGPVPGELLEAARRSMRKARRTEFLLRWRRRLIKTVIALAAMAGLAYGGWEYWRRNKVAGIIEQTGQEIESGRIEEALNLLDGFTRSYPFLAEISEVELRREEVEKLLLEKNAKEEARLKQLGDIRTALTDMPVKGDFSGLDAMIDDSRRLAAGDGEKREFAQLEAKAKEARSASMQRLKDLNRHLGRWRADIRLRENFDAKTPAEQLAKESRALTQLADEIVRTVEEASKIPGIEANWINDAEESVVRARALAKDLAARGDELSDFSGIWNGLAEDFTLENLKRAIHDAVERHPRLSEINRVRDAGKMIPVLEQVMPLPEFEASLWKWLDQGMAVDALFPDAGDEYIRNEAAAALKTQWEGLRRSLRPFGRTKDQEQAMEGAVTEALRLSALRREAPELESARNALLSFGNSIEDHWEVRVRDGSGAPFLYAVSPPDTRTRTAQVVSLVGTEHVSYRQARLAPHSEFFGKIKDMVEEYPGKDWPFALQQLASDCLATDMDPFPKATLSYHLLDLAARTSNEPQRGRLLTLCRELKELQERFGLRDDWLRAGLPNVSAAKREMAAGLESLRGEATDLVREARLRMDSLRRNFPPDRRLIGILGPMSPASGRLQVLPISGMNTDPGGSPLMLFTGEGTFTPLSRISRGSGDGPGILAAEGYGAGTTVWR